MTTIRTTTAPTPTPTAPTPTTTTRTTTTTTTTTATTTTAATTTTIYCCLLSFYWLCPMSADGQQRNSRHIKKSSLVYDPSLVSALLLFFCLFLSDFLVLQVLLISFDCFCAIYIIAYGQRRNNRHIKISYKGNSLLKEATFNGIMY